MKCNEQLVSNFYISSKICPRQFEILPQVILYSTLTACGTLMLKLPPKQGLLSRKGELFRNVAIVAAKNWRRL